MKTNKFVIVTGSCMFLLLMMIIFNVGGGTKTTYSAESTGYCYKCYNSAGTIVQQQWSATNMDGAVVGVACGPTNNGGTWRAGTSSTEASCPNHTASESDNPGSTTKGCDNGTPEADGDGCASCNNGYKLQTNLNADGTSYNICVEDSSVSTGYCYKCYNSAGTIVQQTWSATNMDSAVVGVACGPTNNRGTWRAGTSSTEASCPNQTASSKITPSISVSGSKTSGTQGTTGTLSVTVTNASSCPGTISVRNTYGMKVEGSVTFTTKSIDTNGPHTFSYSATGEGGTTGNLLVSYVPNDLTKCSQPNNASFNFKINISDTDNRTKST